MVLRFVLRLAVLAALAAPAAHAQDVAVPNFWDLRARLERPVPGAIGAIRFLVTDDFPPFSFRDRRGQLIGFDIDLAEAVCKVLEVACAVQVRPFDTLGKGLADGSGNAIIAGFDPERAGTEGLIATQAYLKIPGRFVAARDGGFDPDEPKKDGPEAARRVGIACGSAHQAFLARFFPAIETGECYGSTAEALAALRKGDIAAVFGDAVGLAFWIHGEASQDCCRFAGGPYVDDRYFGAGLSIVVREQDRPLKTALDYALREVYRSGKYEELYLRYFPVGLF